MLAGLRAAPLCFLLPRLYQMPQRGTFALTNAFLKYLIFSIL